MLELLEIKRFPRKVYIVFSRATKESKNMSILGTFHSYQKAKEFFNRKKDELCFKSIEDIPASGFATSRAA